jgi:diguanylate cyclase (GGDEF)-like protein
MIPLRLLLIEDSPDDAALVVRELTKGGYAVTSHRVDTLEALSLALKHDRWDLAIADYTMPGFSGTAALAFVREYDPEVPFIFVSGTIGEDVAVTAMQTGAHDYIGKSNIARLVPAVERQLRIAAGRITRTRAETRLAPLVYRDALTDLPNRVLLHDRLRQGILASQRAHRPLTLVVLEIHGLTTVGESGPEAADPVVRALAARLRGLLREVDTIARLGVDRFALVLPETGSEGAALASGKVLRDLARPLTIEGRALVIESHLGIAVYPEHGSSADDLLERAEAAMQFAKSSRSGYAMSVPDHDRLGFSRLTLMTALREAIERGEFSCDYQPIVHLQSGRVLSVEALVRWNHPGRGRLPPREFIELVEETWLIGPLTMTVIDHALGDLAARDGLPWVSVAVNVSSRNLRDPDFPDRVADVLRRHGAAPSALVLEIRESALMLDAPRTTSCLSRLHDLGIALAVDNFGKSQSSTSHFRYLPIDRLKIDRTVVNCATAGDDAVLQSVIDLGHSLGLIVVGTGVESDDVSDRLRELTCDAAQGNLIARPSSATDTRRWVARRNAARM